MSILKDKQAIIEFMQWKNDIISRTMKNEGIRTSATYFTKIDAEAIMKFSNYKINKIVKAFNKTSSNANINTYYKLSDSACCPFCIAYEELTGYNYQHHYHSVTFNCIDCPYARVHNKCESGKFTDSTSDYGIILNALTPCHLSYTSIVSIIGKNAILTKLKELFGDHD